MTKLIHVAHAEIIIHCTCMLCLFWSAFHYKNYGFVAQWFSGIFYQLDLLILGSSAFSKYFWGAGLKENGDSLVLNICTQVSWGVWGGRGGTGTTGTKPPEPSKRNQRNHRNHRNTRTKPTEPSKHRNETSETTETAIETAIGNLQRL